MTLVLTVDCEAGNAGDVLLCQKEEGLALLTSGKARPATVAELRSGAVVREVVHK